MSRKEILLHVGNRVSRREPAVLYPSCIPWVVHRPAAHASLRYPGCTPSILPATAVHALLKAAERPTRASRDEVRTVRQGYPCYRPSVTALFITVWSPPCRPRGCSGGSCSSMHGVVLGVSGGAQDRLDQNDENGHFCHFLHPSVTSRGYAGSPPSCLFYP